MMRDRLRVPDDFPNKGKFRTYHPDWSRAGYADEPQYPGQQPIRFPEEWTPFECFMAREQVGL